MRYLRKWQLASVCLLALALLPFAPAPRGTAQAPGYTLTDLGALGAGDVSRALGLNECGRVVGESTLASGSSNTHPFYWSDGVMTDLGTLGGATGTAAAVNQGGAVVGSSLTSGGVPHAFYKPSGGAMTDLGTLGGFTVDAQDLNASGQVVGQSEDGSFQDRAFIWQSGTMQALTAPWGTPIRAFGINDAGQIAGSANVTGVAQTHAFVTIDNVAVDLGTLGGSVSFANEVNDLGEVAGQSFIFTPELKQPFHAFRWRDANGNKKSDPGEMQDLGTLGGQYSYAYDLNNGGLVVGRSETVMGNSATHAFIWSSADGVMRDLNDVVAGTGWTFQEARGVNDRGQIAGTGLNPDGKVHAFLLTPTNVGPSPCDPTPTPTPTPMPGALEFSAATYTVGEGGGSVVVSVSRTGGSDGAVSVNYATSDGTATAGASADYIATNGTLNFANGETTKTFSVTINEDTLFEGNETVNLTLSTPGGGATLGAQSTATLNINDNDAQPTLQFSSATYSVAENAGTATITVTRTGGTNGGVTVNYATTTGGTAMAGSDYTAINPTTLTFGVGEMSKTFNVSITNDTLYESDETVNLTLSNPMGGATLGAQSSTTLTITDNDAQPTLQFSSATYSDAEGDAGSHNVTITVTRAGGTNGGVTINYATTTGGTATTGSDYMATSGTLTFAEDDTSKTFTVSVTGDTLDEPNETVNLTLSNPGGGAALGSQTTATLTITDDDGPPALSINDVTVTEGNAGTTAATFTVTLLPASGQAVSVNYATADGTATTANNDYDAKSGTLNFDAGETSKTVTVNVNGDTTPEPHETFFVNLSGESNATVSDAQGQGTINNDDTALSINDVSATEAVASASGLTFTVSLSQPTVNNVSANYATADGTATAGSDYTATSGTLNILAGATSGTITVPVSDDNIYEANETFFVNLTNPTNATISDAQGQGTIANDEAPSTFLFSSSTYSAGEGGGNAVVTVTRTGSTAGGVSVNYATTTGGTATAGSDYTATSGTLTFASGETSKTFNVPVLEDTLFEGNETVNLALSSPTGGTLGTPNTAVLTINDNDTQPTLQFSSATYSVAENAGTATITVTRTGGSNGGVTVNYATTTGGTATAGSDYTAIASGTLTFGVGETSKTFGVTVNDDALDEPDETVNLTLSSAGGGGTLGTPNTAVLTITDNDAAPTLSIGDVTVNEGNSGTTDAVFNVTLSAASGKTVTVNYDTSNGTAVAPGDYTSASGTVTFNPGETSKNVTVQVLGDTLDEPDETFNVNLSSPSNATLNDGQGVGTITDDDAAPTLSVGDATVLEGNSGTTNAVFTVTLSAASGKTVSVSYATADATATAGSDYTATSGTVTFNPGETSKSFAVAVKGDTLDEADETFNVNLSSATNATINDGTGVGTITDDDAPPSLSIGDVTVTEGNSGTTAATFNVSLSAPSGLTVSVNYATADGTATQPGDYAAASGTLTFAPGETSKTVTVNVNGDTSNEADETFFVNLSGASNATIADAQGQGTITNDDTPALRFSQAAYTAGESAHFVTVTVTRTGDAAPAVGVSFATSDGTATERRDYTAASGRLQFAAGETSKSFDVLLTEDAYAEASETINLTLSAPTGGAALGNQPTATVNITDTPPIAPNPIDVSSNFVRQHYHDFLNREPDADGLAFWTNEIEQCGADQGCREVKRINVSAAFFLSIEFQQTGYLVYRTYKVAYGDATSPNVGGTVPVVRLQEFLPDTRSIGEGVVVGAANWEQKLEANKNAYMDEFVQRQRFLTAFPLTLTPAQFVDKLNQNAGRVLTQSERDGLVNDLSNNVRTRAQVLRLVAENNALQENEKRRAFVLMQFYGYLRRNPDDPQDTDFRGWKFWLDKLNEHNGNFVEAEMVKAFLDSIEYRTRFAP